MLSRCRNLVFKFLAIRYVISLPAQISITLILELLSCMLAIKDLSLSPNFDFFSLLADS